MNIKLISTTTKSSTKEEKGYDHIPNLLRTRHQNSVEAIQGGLK